MALGCVPSAKVGNDIFNSNNTGQSQIQNLQLTYNCQYVQSAYVNDLATRYVKQFAVFGNSLNFNPGAGDAFFDTANEAPYGDINTAIFNGGKRPNLDAVQSGLGNAPVMYANNKAVVRNSPAPKAVEVGDHSVIYNDADFNSTDISNPYEGAGI